MTEQQFIKERIHEIAVEHSPNYPNIETTDTLEQLWAIECAIKGTYGANKDLHRLIDKMREKLGWTRLETLEFWKQNVKNK